ncbi:unnamed protein product [Caenorhabditis nigoni]
MVTRTNGIAFMTIHRFLIIVKPNLKITQWIQKSKPWKIWILFWGPSIILSAVCFSDTEIGFDSPEKMLLAMDPEIISTEQIVILRKYFPLAYGTFSFIGPFTVLIFNKDVSKRMKLLILRKNQDGHTESSVVSTLKPKTVTVTSKT